MLDLSLLTTPDPQIRRVSDVHLSRHYYKQACKQVVSWLKLDTCEQRSSLMGNLRIFVVKHKNLCKGCIMSFKTSVKVLFGTFNKEKVLPGVFSKFYIQNIVKHRFYMSAVDPGSWRHIHTTENTAQYPFSWPRCHPTAAHYTPHSPDNVSIRMVQKIHLNTLIMKYMGGGDNQTGFLD